MSDSGPMVDDAHRFAPAAPEEDIVYGACCPWWHSAGSHNVALERWISFMQEAGIERVCCLLTGRHLAARDATVGRCEAVFGAENVLHAPIPDDRLAAPETLEGDVLPFLDAAAAAGRPVVVHSLAGLGRTGQVLAAWLVGGRGYTPDRALETVQKMGRDPFQAVGHGGVTRQDLLDLLTLAC